jgi:hypothetical protein
MNSTVVGVLETGGRRMCRRRLFASFRRILLVALLLCSFCIPSPRVWSALQFDVFLGYDGVVPEASWFPITFEVKNDGPPFIGTVELSTGNQGQVRRLSVELPTGTLKKFSIPLFSTMQGFTWDVRLIDERGKVRAEQLGLRARKQTASETPIVGSLARTANGIAVLKPVLPQSGELQPASARLQPATFPDNPLELEGLDMLYLNSEKAPELKVNQVNALAAWLNSGGHLVVAVEQINEITATPWLQSMFPCDLKDLRTVSRHSELQEWLKSPTGVRNLRLPSSQPGSHSRTRNAATPNATAENPFADLPDDPKFEAADLQIATGTIRDGRVVVGSSEAPLIVTANRGRGRITVLLFSPERDPMREWSNLPIFWAKLAEVPGAWYVSSDFNHQAWSPSTDGVVGALIDTKQVHKLPVEWLLLLLIVYLVVIGPLDQFWLKRIGRPMLTWLTFPCYVVLFSLLIYFIGYKLRAGESELNELHFVDVLLHGSQAELHGHTYASIYSPSNQRYTLESQEKYATFRGEFSGSWGANQSSEKANVVQNGDNFKAEIFVPVWTSQLFVSDWWQPDAIPLDVSVTSQGGGWQVKVDNRTNRKLTDLQIVIENHVIPLGPLAISETKSFNVSKERGTPIRDFVSKHGQIFQTAAGARQQAFGGNDSSHIADVPSSAVALSFISQLSRTENQNNYNNYMNNFIAPRGLDLTSVIDHGSAVVLAWAADSSPIKSMYQFSPKRSHKDTLWRIAVPVR